MHFILAMNPLHYLLFLFCTSFDATTNLKVGTDILLEGKYNIQLMHDIQHLQLTTLRSLTRMLWPYCSVIFWSCRKWGLIFGITFYQSNYLSTLFNLTQPIVRSHRLPLNIDDPGHGQPWHIFLAKCRRRLLFVIYASRGAPYNSTLVTIIISSLRTARTSARLFPVYNCTILGQQQESCSVNPLQSILHCHLFTILSIVQITSAK